MRGAAVKGSMERRSRPATYGTGTRLSPIVYGLVGRPHGWGFEAIQEELDISERTLLRYVAACRREMVDAAGRSSRSCAAASDASSTVNPEMLALLKEKRGDERKSVMANDRKQRGAGRES